MRLRCASYAPGSRLLGCSLRMQRAADAHQDAPPDASLVAAGDVVEFHRVSDGWVGSQEPGQKRRKVRKYVAWTVEKTEWTPIEHDCGTNCIVKRHIYHGAYEAHVLPLHPRPDPDRKNPTVRRLRLDCAGEDGVYLQQIVAYAWHRHPDVPAGLTWPQYRRGTFDSDHLPDRRLREVPGWVVAGWLQAVPRALHRARGPQRALAREVREAADREEKTARRARARRPPLQHKLAEGRQLLLSWDCQIPGDLAIGAHAWEREDALDSNPYLAELFIEHDGAAAGAPANALTPRQALLAWCLRQTRSSS